MTISYPPARMALQFTSGNPDQQLRTAAEVVNSMLAGKLNTTIFVTLDPGVATTAVQDARISAQTTAAFCPTSANAAAAIPTLWVTPTNKQLVIHHDNNAQTDRTFNMAITG